MQQSLVVPARGKRGDRGWRRQPIPSILMFSPALAALLLHSFVAVPRQSYRDTVRPDPFPPYAEEPAPPDVASLPAAQRGPNTAPTGSSTPWVDPDEPAR